jgi:RNA polymerase sigma factor (sigma-70 family)
MSAASLAAFISRCRVLCRPRRHVTDAELLGRFTRQRDADAFGQLLERYAPLVWGVCRRILYRESDCEDAFQAVFLALVRRPNAVDSSQALGAWLHTVAVRVAHRTLTQSRRQQPKAILPEPATRGDVADDVGSRELLRIVDEEIERLPAAVRAPLILCCLEGRTRDEAAAVLGCSVAAVKGRLERGRDLLRWRLQRRGLSLPAALLVLGLTTERVRADLWTKTMQSALHTPTPTMVALADAVTPAATISKGKLLFVALVLVSSAAGAIGSLLTEKPPPINSPSQTQVVASERKNETPQVRRDRYGEPLPKDALARLGTVRWRHGVLVFALAYSPDGKMIATTGLGRALVLWDAATGKPIRVFPSSGQPRRVAFSPDGKMIATSQRTGQLWDVASGRMLRELKSIQSTVYALAFAPDGKTLATTNSDEAIHLWDPTSGEEIRRIDCKQGAVNTIAFAPDGKLLASGGCDGTICLWDAATGKDTCRITTLKKMIASIVFSPDGKQLAAGCNEDSPRLWDVATGREVRAFGDDKEDAFAPLAFSPDGKLLASGHPDGTFRLWDATSGEARRRWQAGWGVAYSAAFSPDGKTIATAVLWDGGIRLWDVATGHERDASEDHRGLITVLRFAADKKTLISAGWDRSVLCWDLATQTPHRLLKWTTDCFGGFSLSPDGNTLAACQYKTGEMWLWDVRTGKASKLPLIPSTYRDQSVQTIAFSPDGQFLASGDFGKAMIHIWDVRERIEVRQLKGSAIPSRLAGMRLLFSPDGKMLACGTLGPGGEVKLHLWDVASGKELHLFDNQGNGISPDAFSPDGKVLATAQSLPKSGGASVRLFDMATGKELCRHSGHTGFGAVAFSPDGKLVVSGGGKEDDNFIDVWEATTGQLVRRFEGHHSRVSAVTFASDGLTIASGAGDSTILLWDITGRQKDGKLRHIALTPYQLESCWKDLANEDAAKAYNALWALVAAPEQAVPFLKKQLSPVPRPDAKTIARLIADLDSDDFAVRQKAAEELRKHGDAVASDLRKVLDGKPSLEVRRRLQQLFDQSRDWTAERLRDHRAIQALEHIGTQPAKEVLQHLTTGIPETLRTEEAKAALGRLAK